MCVSVAQEQDAGGLNEHDGVMGELPNHVEEETLEGLDAALHQDPAVARQVRC